MLIIADSSALIALATCDGLPVLSGLYENICVPRAVYDEVVQQEKPQAATLSTFLSGRVLDADIAHWVLAAGRLGQGELEAMALYKQLNADTLLIDDHRARVVAEHNRIDCIGALGVLLVAKQRGVIESITPYVQKLRLSPIRYGNQLLNKVLKPTYPPAPSRGGKGGLMIERLSRTYLSPCPFPPREGELDD